MKSTKNTKKIDLKQALVLKHDVFFRIDKKQNLVEGGVSDKR